MRAVKHIAKASTWFFGKNNDIFIVSAFFPSKRVVKDDYYLIN